MASKSPSLSAFSFSKRPSSSSSTKSPIFSQPKVLSKRKSLLSTIPWLSSKLLDDSDKNISQVAIDDKNIDTQLGINSNQQSTQNEESQDLINAGSTSMVTIYSVANAISFSEPNTSQVENIEPTFEPKANSTSTTSPQQIHKSNLFESPIKEFSVLEQNNNNSPTKALLDNSLDQITYDHSNDQLNQSPVYQSYNSSLSTHLPTDTLSQLPNSGSIIDRLNSQIAALTLQNKKLQTDNALYDQELNKALTINMDLESKVVELDESLIQLQADLNNSPLSNHHQVENLTEQLKETILREQESGFEMNNIIQDYNTLIDQYNQLKSLYTEEKGRFTQQEEDLRHFHNHFKYLNEQNNILKLENETLRSDLRKLQFEAGSFTSQITQINYLKDLYSQALGDNEALKEMIIQMQNNQPHFNVTPRMHYTPSQLINETDSTISPYFSINKSIDSLKSSSEYMKPIADNPKQPLDYTDFQNIFTNYTKKPQDPKQQQITETHSSKQQPHITETPSSRNGTKYQDVYEMSYSEAKQFLEKELVKLTARKDVLNSEYQRGPSYGNKVMLRKKREELENALDDTERDISSVRSRMKSMGIL